MSEDGRSYHIRNVLGRGGFGTVYRAELRSSGGFVRQVALKVLNRDVASNVDLASRLRDEARVLGLIRHRAIVQVDGLAMLDDRWAIVMELVDGADLGRLVDQGPVPVGPALEIAAEVASALHVAHTALGPDGIPLQLLHRDLKPTNILLTRHGEIKLVDFGVARGDFEGREARTRDVTFGSPGYVAPERLDLEESAAGDVYALGVVFYELLVGDRLGRVDTRPKHHDKDIAAALLKTGHLELPEGVLSLVGEMLALAPTERPSARDVESRARDLRGTVDGPWLRDWAEQTLGELPDRTLDEGHDFSDSVLVEREDTHPGKTIDPATYESRPARFISSTRPPDPTAATVLHQLPVPVTVTSPDEVAPKRRSGLAARLLVVTGLLFILMGIASLALGVVLAAAWVYVGTT